MDSIIHIQYYVGSGALTFRRDTMEIKSPIENGLIKDWELMEQIYSFSFKELLRIDSATTPFLLAEPSFNTK